MGMSNMKAKHCGCGCRIVNRHNNAKYCGACAKQNATIRSILRSRIGNLELTYGVKISIGYIKIT